MNFLVHRSGGVRGWNNGEKISSSIDSHHIYPRDYMKEDDREDVESIVNRILIPKIDNIKIGKKAPSIYLNEILERNPELTELIGTQSMIPKELITGELDDNYDKFLELRASMLYDALEEELFSNTSEIQEKFVLSS